MNAIFGLCAISSWSRFTDGIAGTGTPVASLAELNSLNTAWVEQVYHQRVHSETDQTPLERFLAAGAPAPVAADLLAEAFRWGEWRTVTATAQVHLHGNRYDVDPVLAGTRVELVFNPFDLDDIDVRAHSRSYGKASPSRIRRHVHPKARTDTPAAPAPTGIDYLRLIEERHTRVTQCPTAVRPPQRPRPRPGAGPIRRPRTRSTRPARNTATTTSMVTSTTSTSSLSPKTPTPPRIRPLEAELAEFAAYLGERRQHTDSTGTDTTGRGVISRVPR